MFSLHLANSCILCFFPTRLTAEDAARPSEKNDVFAALLEEDDGMEEQEGACSSRCRGLVDGEDVSLVLSTCRNPSWSVQCSAVYANTLLVFAIVKSTGERILTISMSTGCVDFGNCSIPVFGRDFPAVQCTLSSQRCHAIGYQSMHHSQHSGVLKYRTVFAIAHCRQRQDSVRSKDNLLPLQEDLYLQLFGPECKLANSPVLLTGSENGHIFYRDLNSLSGSSGGRQPLHPLYSLEQAVIAIHAVALPTKVIHDDPLVVETDERRTTEMNANALVFVGQKGKIAVCTAAEPNQSVANFTEFNVPGPILSSVVVPDQCLLYSTLNTIFEICLKPTCVKNCKSITVGNSTSPVLVPEMAFRFPSRIMNFAGFLLQSVPNLSTGGSESNTIHGRVVGISLKGEVRSFSIVDRSGQAASMDSVSAAQELKHSLTAIQVTSEQIAATKQRLSGINASLAELNNALSLLCDVATVQLSNRAAASCVQSTSASVRANEIASPFHCDLSPMFDKVGILGRRVCIDVQVCYTGHKPLGVGWSLVIQLHYNDAIIPTRASNASAVIGRATEVMSQTFPLAAMQSGSRVQTRVPVDASTLRPLMCTVSCSLHYSTVSVLTELTQRIHSEQTGLSDAQGVTLPLSAKTFDVLDFLQPFQESNRELIPSEKHPHFLCEQKPVTFHQSTSQTPQQSLLHSLELSVSPDTIARLSPLVASGEEASPSSLCTSTLKALLPVIQRNPERIVTRTRERETTSEVKLTAHDGSAVGLKVDYCWEEADVPGALKMVLQAGSRRRLVEVCGCIQKRLQKLEVLDSSQLPESVISLSHDHLCKVHWSLKVCVCVCKSVPTCVCVCCRH